jgi:hypothetical protein
MLDDGSFSRLSKTEQLDWRSRLVKGYRALAHAISATRLRRTLATAAVLLGLAVMPAKAQDFAAPVEAPFGLDQSSVDLLFFADMDNDGDLDVSALPAGMYLFSLSDNSGKLPVTRRFFVR